MEVWPGPDFGDYRALALGIGLTVASAIDIGRRLVPNYLTGTLFILGLCLNAYRDGWIGLSGSALGTVVAVGMTWWFYRRGSLGGGDVKLFAAIGATTGPYEPFIIAVYSLAVGSTIAVAIERYRMWHGLMPGLPVVIPMAPVFACATVLALSAPLLPH